MTQINADLIPALNESLQINLDENISFEILEEKLSSYINHLIQNDFQNLVLLLYRVDVNEDKLKHLLKQNPGEDAGKIIADMVIERQMQKIRSRQEYRRDPTISDEEKW